MDEKTTPFRQFLADCGLTQAECSRRYEIPIRTITHWANGDRECPSYLLKLLYKAEGRS